MTGQDNKNQEGDPLMCLTHAQEVFRTIFTLPIFE